MFLNNETKHQVYCCESRLSSTNYIHYRSSKLSDNYKVRSDFTHSYYYKLKELYNVDL
jgi:hypothetical protein